MNKNIINILLCGAVTLGLASCSENSWNDRYLDGFEGGETYDPSNLEYTLTASDYSTISSAMVASTEDPALQAIYKAVATNQAFPSIELAQEWIPTLLSRSSFVYYYVTNGSNIQVSYNLVNNLPAAGEAIAAATPYTLSKADYQEVWGSETQFVESFSPNHPASEYLPDLLLADIEDPAQGDYAMVSYQTSDQNPDFGGTATTLKVSMPIIVKSRAVGTTNDGFTSVLGTAKINDNITVIGAVTGICKQGFIVTDNTGSMLAYQGNSFDQSSVKIGDVVTIEKKTISQYNGGLQIPISSSSDYVVEETITYNYPAPVTVGYAEAAAACADTEYHNAVYVSFTGVPVVSGNYVNFNFPDSDGGNIQGSAYQVPDALKEKCSELNGKECVVTGYYVSVSSSRYYNVLLTDIQEVPELTSVLTPELKTDDIVSITGAVTAICTRGFILSDNAGSILMYQASGFNMTDVAIGEVVSIENAKIASYNGCFQVAITSSSYTSEGLYIHYNYPEPKTVTGTMAMELLSSSDLSLNEYVEIEVTPFMSGTYLNFQFTGTPSSDIAATLYQAPSTISDDLKNYLGKTVTLRGFYTGVNKNNKLYNIMITDYDVPTVTVESYTQFALMTWDGTAWTEATNAVLLQPSDYQAMGQEGNFISNTADYFPRYLSQKVPYASAGDVQLVAYYSAQDTPACQAWIYDGSTWSNDSYVVNSDQFSKANYSWFYNPSVIVNLPAVRNDPFITAFYQACTDWVYKNIDVPLGSTSITSGVGYVTTYGNNEYWAGTSAYYNNVDIRVASAVAQYPQGWEGMSNEEVQQTMVERLLMTLFPAVLGETYPDAKPIAGVEVTYTVNFILYNGSNINATVVYKVSGPAEFEFDSSNIWKDGKFVIPSE